MWLNDPQEYYSLLVPRLIPLLTSPSTPSTYLRPLSLTIVTLLCSPNTTTASAAQGLILPLIHTPLLSPHSYQADSLGSASAAFLSLALLLPLVLLTPPSSSAHALLLEPVLPQLFGLHWHLQQSRTADPILRREVEGCLRSWGRVGEVDDVKRGLDAVLKAGRGWEASGGSVLPGSPSKEMEDVDGDGEDDEWFWQGGGEDLKVAWGRSVCRLALLLLQMRSVADLTIFICIHKVLLRPLSRLPSRPPQLLPPTLKLRPSPSSPSILRRRSSSRSSSRSIGHQ